MTDKENERALLIQQYKQLKSIKYKQHPNYNNAYKIGFWLLCGMLLMGGFWLSYGTGYSKGKSKNKYKRCKC